MDLTVIGRNQTTSERFEALLSPHFDALHRAAYRLAGNTHDAEDLVQEVCVKIYPRISELEALEHPRSWLLRVLYNLFVDTTRRRDRTHVTSLSAIEDPDSCSFMASIEPGPEEYAEAAILEAVMEQAWQRMEKKQRALLALHDVEGYTLAEMEKITGTKIGTLKSQLHRARVRLGKLLQRESTPVAVVAAKEG
jgi:RNA polymerase sigma factor (sigma-70 family)